MSFATRDGRNWTPDYLISIDANHCIGCGRCFKVCGRNVMTLKGITEGGEVVDFDDDDDEIEKKIMVLNDPGACIGCSACARVCPTDCQTHAPASAEAA
ncbi:ferredoxin III, nif-specific [Bradyrhizobium sp. BWA-3-5]|uniref:ferredoxin III, nif-specific n=1 Tax=Bradyrhizobium sp. BWA-3-5 TaxID=3080013 RepID=UPI00293E2D43|nr:ferredoxin III, nif-specific [Bradyrhizobium sp. BWA-3-5]WOH64103.1 ferredoxin III, nif-specific [Bradyrhizobium sp. BWA-3-5]WOH70153.1 ferredoxin III, nif-specific [Bradyrhizobium sp. BWA-3-5]